MIRKCLILVFTLILTAVSCSSCSPVYVTKAGWEEAKILWRREKIDSLIKSPDIDEKTKAKLQLVLEAREYAKKIGLTPKKSFTLYSKIDRDELLWVLMAAPKTSFAMVTWWFPIVGSIPYKGFFEKVDAEKEAKKLKEKGNDTFIRPSAAFSTLGWFNDPLLSTTLKNDDINLVDTVVHEILHNTIFINDHVDFNESLASFIGAYGAYQFFLEKYGTDNQFTKNAYKYFERNLAFSSFLEELVARLSELYEKHKVENAKETTNKELLLEETLKKREEIIEQVFQEQNSNLGPLQITIDRNREINNASIMASKIYLTKTAKFFELYNCLGEKRSLLNFVELLKKIEQNVDSNNSDPYEELEKEISHTCPNKSLPS